MDLISRQAAISLPVKPKEDRYFQTQNLDDAYDYGWYSLQRCIEKLPSAQPECDEWCHDCKEYDQERHCCPHWNRVIRETLKDVQPERKRGKWIDAYPNTEQNPMFMYGVCSICGYEQSISNKLNFCPNCGAKMERT